MRLEPRVEKLEARVPDDTLKVNKIVLVGIGPGGDVVTSAVSHANNGGWTQFEQASRR